MTAGGRAGEPGQVRIPGGHEPRDPHADDRRARDGGPAGGGEPEPDAAALCRHDPPLGPASARASSTRSSISRGSRPASWSSSGSTSRPRTCSSRCARSWHRRWPSAAWSCGSSRRRRARSMVRGDPTRLKQVLVNLVGNGLKFTRQGSVTLTVRELPAPADGVRLRFEVAGHRHRHRRAIARPSCSSPSSRPTARPPATMAAAASASRSAGGWSRRWAA